MIDRLVTFLRALPRGTRGGTTDPKDDARVAAAALMVHVMDADGERKAGEKQRLLQALSEGYDVEGSELERVFSAGEKADREAIDLYAFTSVLKRHLDEGERAYFIELMWDVVYADGELHELEENVVWRVAELIGVDGRERIAARNRARAAARE